MRVSLVVCHDIYNSTHPQTPSEEVAWSQKGFCSECYKECYCVTPCNSVTADENRIIRITPYHVIR